MDLDFFTVNDLYHCYKEIQVKIGKVEISIFTFAWSAEFAGIWTTHLFSSHAVQCGGGRGVGVGGGAVLWDSDGFSNYSKFLAPQGCSCFQRCYSLISVYLNILVCFALQSIHTT